jgi:predicted phosphodiesterase
MVIHKHICAVSLIIFVIFVIPVLTESCDMLILTNDVSSRFSYHDTFNFLDPADRTPGLGDAYSFIVASDIHDSPRFADLETILISSDKFIVITGDISGDGTRAQLQNFVDTANTFSVPCYPVIGNHDIYDNNGGPWKELIGSSCYRIDDGSASQSTTLFILDSANSFFGKDQLDWLESEMKSANPLVFTFTHNNFFVSAMFDTEHITDNNERARFLHILKDRCKVLFTGHLHKRVIQSAGGILCITLEDFQTSGSYCRVRVSPAGITREFINLP